MHSQKWTQFAVTSRKKKCTYGKGFPPLNKKITVGGLSLSMMTPLDDQHSSSSSQTSRPNDTRQKTVAKPEPPAGQLDIQAEQSWVCPLCEVEVYQEPGLRARELFRRKRWNHLLTRHTAEERRAVPKLGAVSQL